MKTRLGATLSGILWIVIGSMASHTEARGAPASSGAPLSYTSLQTRPFDAPSVVLCRDQLFASSNASGISRIDPRDMKVLEAREYPDVGTMHQLTTDGRMLYVAYFTKACPTEDRADTCTPTPTHGILKVDPADLSIVAQLALEGFGVLGWPEGFVWHDGYLYEAAFGFRGQFECRIPKIEPSSMTFVGAVALPDMEGCHGITYDGSNLYVLGVPPVDSASRPGHYYKIDLDSLEIEQTITFPEGLHHYGGNLYLARNGFLYTSPGYPEVSGGGLVKIDPVRFTVVDVLLGAGRHWLASEGRYVYLLEGDHVVAVDPDAMVRLGRSSPPFESGVSTLHYGYVAEDGYLYLGFENQGGHGFIAKMVTLAANDGTAPSAATAIQTLPTDGVIWLGWTAAADPDSGVLAYKIYRALLGSSLEHLVTVPGASVQFSDRSAEPGQTYVYEIAAVDGAGLEGPRQTTLPVLNGVEEVPVGGTLRLDLDSRALPDELRVEAVFTSPSGRKFQVSGAYDGPGAWSVRFQPTEPGPWRYAISSSDQRLAKFGGFKVETGGNSRPRRRR
jgi:hypothetical protein